MSEDEEYDYLGESDQENDYASDEDANPTNEDSKQCNVDSKLFETNLLSGNAFPGQSNLFDSISNMKNTIYMNVFQKGGPEEIHDTALLGKYVNLIGRIWKSVGYNQPLNLDDQKDEIKQVIQTFLELLHQHLQEHNSPIQNEMRTQFLRLHLHCFPYCMREKCLSMA